MSEFLEFVIVPYPNFKLPKYTFDQQKEICLKCRYQQRMKCTHPRVNVQGRLPFESCFAARNTPGWCEAEAFFFEPIAISER